MRKTNETINEMVNRYFKNWEDKKPAEDINEEKWRLAMQKENERLMKKYGMI